MREGWLRLPGRELPKPEHATGARAIKGRSVHGRINFANWSFVGRRILIRIPRVRTRGSRARVAPVCGRVLRKESNVDLRFFFRKHDDRARRRWEESLPQPKHVRSQVRIFTTVNRAHTARSPSGGIYFGLHRFRWNFLDIIYEHDITDTLLSLSLARRFNTSVDVKRLLSIQKKIK